MRLSAATSTTWWSVRSHTAGRRSRYPGSEVAGASQIRKRSAGRTGGCPGAGVRRPQAPFTLRRAAGAGESVGRRDGLPAALVTGQGGPAGAAKA